MNNDKNQTNNSTNEKVTRVSSMEEMIATLDGDAIKISENGETKFFYLKENEKGVIAHQIAETYQNPSFSKRTQDRKGSRRINS